MVQKYQNCHSLAKGNLIHNKKTNCYGIPNQVGNDTVLFFWTGLVTQREHNVPQRIF
jgi:hypothetical protein